MTMRIFVERPALERRTKLVAEGSMKKSSQKFVGMGWNPKWTAIPWWEHCNLVEVHPSWHTVALSRTGSVEKGSMGKSNHKFVGTGWNPKCTATLAWEHYNVVEVGPSWHTVALHLLSCAQNLGSCWDNANSRIGRAHV